VTALPVRLDDLCLGATSPKKVVHHEGCRYARRPYAWARQCADLDAFTGEMIETGAWRWHRFCQACCGDLDDAVGAALMANGIVA
jgi:hypothetical protein